jgi:predicted MFS family arabinose efflux permease
MAGIGRFPTRRSVHNHCPGLVCVAINRFRGSNWPRHLLFSVANNHIESIDGKLLDRYQPRTIMAIDNFGRACIIATIPLLYMLGASHLSRVYVLALFSGILSPATEVGCRIAIPRLVPDEELEKANSLSSISWDFATLVGPALAGILVTVIGAPKVLLLDAASFGRARSDNYYHWR